MTSTVFVVIVWQTGGTKTCTYECFCDYDFNALPSKVKNIGKKNNCGPNSLLNSWSGVSPPPPPFSPPPFSPPPPNPLLLTTSLDYPYCANENTKTMKVKDPSSGLTVVCLMLRKKERTHLILACSHHYFCFPFSFSLFFFSTLIVN